MGSLNDHYQRADLELRLLLFILLLGAKPQSSRPWLEDQEIIQSILLVVADASLRSKPHGLQQRHSEAFHWLALVGLQVWRFSVLGKGGIVLHLF